MVLVAAAVFAFDLLGRGTGGHWPDVFTPEAWRSASPDSATPQTTGLALPAAPPATLQESTRVTAAPRRAPAPLPAKRPPGVAGSPRPARGGAAVVAPGRLFVSATPWGQLYVDGRLMGNTPKADLPISAGWHRVRVVHDGFEPFEQTIQVPAGQDVRLTSIVLRELGR